MDKLTYQGGLVTIVTPSYNSLKYIGEAIHSVMCQTYKNWEMIIVDDKSTDESVKYIRRFSQNEPRVKLVVLHKNVGAAMARNKALELAKGQYVAFLDSDDIWLPEKLETQLHFLKSNNYSFTFTSYTPFSEDGTKNFSTINAPHQLTYEEYCKNTIIGCLTVMIDREITGELRMENIRSSHDMALWLALIKKGHIAYGFDRVLAKYRVVSSSNTANKLHAAKDVWAVYRDIEKISLIKSIYYFIQYSLNAVRRRV